MKPRMRVVSGLLALALVALGAVSVLPAQPVVVGGAAQRVAGAVPAALGGSSTLPVTVTVSGPYTPTLSVAVRDLPPGEPDLPGLDREGVQRDQRGFVGPDIQMPPHGNVLAELQSNAPAPTPDDFGTPILNFAGVQDNSSPPDDTGDVGLNHFLQGDNGPNGSRVTVYDKAGGQLAQFDMEDLAANAPCTSGYCDPIIQYDELADRWMIAEFDSSAATLCVYVSRTPDPTGQWWAYAFDPPGGMQDYPKYAVWPDGYYIAANNGGTVIVLERADMLNGAPATMQTFNIGELPGFGFQLTVPATLEGAPPPAGAPAYYLRPRDTEIHSGTCPNCDLMEMWALHVDWSTPGNSALTSLPGVQLTDWDQTLCGTGSDWSCMSQPGTSQKLDPIREPVHYPLQYRNFGTHETLVGCFAEDVDGQDRAAVHWFEIRRTPPGVGNWVNYQEGVLGNGVNDIHRSVCSAAMDSAGNIAVGYTRTGANAPYYPSIYYAGRLASDPLGTMPYYDMKIWDATTSKTNNERWGDYSGIGVDPVDGCTFWYTTEYGGSGQTRIAAFKFDACGTPDFTLNASPDVAYICAGSDATYTVSLGIVSGFSNSVTLTSTGLPAGTTQLFDPNPVVPGNDSILTIGNTGGAAAGSYIITIAGAAAGSPGHQESVVLNVYTAEPDAAALLLPANGALDISTKPTFDWDGVAIEYALQVAADPSFAAPVVDLGGILTTTVTLQDPLALASCYYWRVQGTNSCGTGPWSETFHFATAALGVIFADDIESGAGNWTHAAAQGTDHWAISTAQSHSPTHSWFVPDDSTLTDSRLWNTAAVAIGANSTLSFWHRYQFEGSSYDGSVLEISTNGGGTWTDLGPYITANGYNGTISTGYSNPLAGRAAWTGDLTAWTEVTVDLNAFSGQNANIRWRIGCDSSVSDVGWYIDDVEITAPLPPNPAPEVLSITPDQGTPLVTTPVTITGQAFVDTPVVMLESTQLLGVTWVSSTTLQAVVPAGMAPGVYDLVVINPDCQSATLPDAFTIVSDCVAPEIEAANSGPVELGGSIHFTATLITGTTPVSYTWDMGGPGSGSGLDTATPVYTYTAAGDFVATALVTNSCGADEVTTTATVECTTPAVSFASDSPVLLGEVMHFTSTVSGTGPLAYAWDMGDGVGTSTAAHPTYTYTAAGDFTVTLVVTGACGVDSFAAVVTVAAPCADLTGITISGPLSGAPGLYTFTTSYEPAGATLPIVYLWDNGDDTASSARTLDVGSYTLVVTATNCAAALVSDTHTVIITAPPVYWVYLPIVFK